jgi:hypothetical protein
MQNSNYFVTAGGRAPGTDGIRASGAGPARFLPGAAWTISRPEAFPVRNRWQAATGTLTGGAGRQAGGLAFTCLPGTCIENRHRADCRTLGDAGPSASGGGRFPQSPLLNPCGAAWRERTGRRLAPLLSADERGRLLAELDFRPLRIIQTAARHHSMPTSFATMCCGRRWLSGVLDFYFAGEDACFSIWRLSPTTGCADAAACGTGRRLRSVRP